MNKQDEWVEVYEGIQRETRVMDSGRGREASDGGERREIAEHGYALGYPRVLGLPRVIYQVDNVCCGWV